MTIEVMRWQIQFDFVGFPGWNQFRYVVAYVDDVTHAITVKIRDGSDNIALSPVSGPSSLYQGTNGMATRLTQLPFYQYCDGTTLRRIGEINSFPYAAFNDFPNSNACVVAPVCDLEISSSFTLEDTTDPDSADGEIQVSATSSNGVIKYALDDFNYETEGNTTGLFTGLLPGTYTVYAKDEVGCQDTINVTIKVTTNYGVRYRGEYNTVGGFDTRIDIAQRGYEDSTTEICFSGNPFVLDYDTAGKYTSIIASHCVIELLEEEEDDFVDLFTNDDRKFRVYYYKFLDSSWVLMWTGYVIPEFYQKPFVRGYNNYVTVKASDQLGQMKDEAFVDASENKFRGELSQIEIIANILKKTDLNINIRAQDNIFEEDMDTDESPLAQAFVDVRIFEDLKCDDVLNHVIKCKSGLRLFQSYGVWWLVRSEFNIASFDYFEYDLDATLVDTATFVALKSRVAPSATPGLVWANASQRELYETNYGKFILTHKLGFDDNLIDEGRFEEDDIVDIGNGNKTFKNWSVTMGQAGVSSGLEQVENRGSKGALFIDFRSASGTQTDTIVYSKEINLEPNTYGSSNKIKFKFDYLGLPFYKIPWIRFAWEIRFISALDSTVYYLKDLDLPDTFIPWTTEEEYAKNDIYIDKYNSFQTFEKTVRMPGVYGGTIRIAFYMHNHAGRDYATLDALADEPTSDGFSGVAVFLGQRRLAYHDSGAGGDDFTYFYELEEGTDADNRPEVVRPDDYSDSGPSANPRVWKMKGAFFAGGAAITGLVNKFLFDNVQLTYLPFDPLTSRNYTPPSTKQYIALVNKFNKENYEEEFLLGDLPIKENTNPPEVIENSRDLYRGFLRLEDGTPTDYWYREGVEESKKLLELALNDRVEQMKNIQKRIQAEVHQRDVYYAFVNSLSYDSRRFINSKYVLNDLRNIITAEFLQMTTGSDGEPPVETGAFSTAYSDDFDNI